MYGQTSDTKPFSPLAPLLVAGVVCIAPWCAFSPWAAIPLTAGVLVAGAGASANEMEKGKRYQGSQYRDDGEDTMIGVVFGGMVGGAGLVASGLLHWCVAYTPPPSDPQDGVRLEIVSGLNNAPVWSFAPDALTHFQAGSYHVTVTDVVEVTPHRCYRTAGGFSGIRTDPATCYRQISERRSSEAVSLPDPHIIQWPSRYPVVRVEWTEHSFWYGAHDQATTIPVVASYRWLLAGSAVPAAQP